MFKRILLNIIRLFFTKCLVLVLTILFTRVVISTIGENNYGEYVYLWSIVLVLLSCEFGFLNGLRNDYIKIKLRGDNICGEISKCRFYIFIFSFISTIVFIIIVISGLYELKIVVNRNIYLFSLTLIPIIQGFRVIHSINFANHKPHYNVIINIIQLLLSISSIKLLSIYKECNINNVIIIVLMSHIVSFLIFKNFVNKTNIKVNFNSVIKNHRIKINTLKRNFLFFAVQILYIFYTYINIFIIKTDYSKSNLNEFTLSYQYLNIVFLTFIGLITPFWSEINEAKENNKKSLRKLANLLIATLIVPSVGIIIMINWRQSIFPLIIGIKSSQLSYQTFLCTGFYIFSTCLIFSSAFFHNAINSLKLQVIVILFAITYIYVSIKIKDYKSFHSVINLTSCMNVMIFLILFASTHYFISKKEKYIK